MRNTVLRRTAALVIGSALTCTACGTAPAFAQSSGSQSGKQPAPLCDGMDKASKAYANCIKAQEQAPKTTPVPSFPSPDQKPKTQ